MSCSAMSIRLAPRIFALCAPLVLFACGGNETTQQPPPVVAVTLSALTVSPEAVDVVAGLELRLSAKGTFSDGSEKDMTEEVEWISSDTSIAVISNDAGSRGLLRGVRAGAITVKVQKDAIVGERSGAVGNAALTGLAITGVAAEEAVERRSTKTLVAMGTFTDQTTSPVTSELTWSSSDETVATISADGELTTLVAGNVTITVTRGELTASVPLSVTCTYPVSASSPIISGATMPNLHWAAARNSDGSAFEFSMEDVYCGRQQTDAKVIFFVVGAGWCPNCPAFVRRTNSLAAEITAAGGLVVYTEMQDENYDPTDSTHATAYIDRLIGRNAPGLRVGDTDISAPANLPFNRAGEITAIPFVLAVRTSDMKYVNNSNYLSLNFPFVDVASDIDTFDTLPTPLLCGQHNEEAGEPNNTAAEAAPIAVGETIEGGICGSDADYFVIDTEGGWRARLNFRNDVGDLDVVVWDPATNAPLESNGRVIGSTTTDDEEEFIWFGPAVLKVSGYQGGKSPYSLTIEGR